MPTNQTISQLQSTDRETFFHPSTHASDHAHGKIPVNIIQSGKGIYIKNQQGTEILDAFAGLYCVNVGYGRTEIAEAIYEQAKKRVYYHTYVGHSNEAVIANYQGVLLIGLLTECVKFIMGCPVLMQTKRK